MRSPQHRKILSGKEKISKEKNEAWIWKKKWLGMRAKLVIAEKELNQAMLAKLSIEAGIARFEKLNGQFPSDEGFIVDRERISWASTSSFEKSGCGQCPSSIKFI